MLITDMEPIGMPKPASQKETSHVTTLLLITWQHWSCRVSLPPSWTKCAHLIIA